MHPDCVEHLLIQGLLPENLPDAGVCIRTPWGVSCLNSGACGGRPPTRRLASTAATGTQSIGKRPV